jgi:hypothetical protein
VTILLTVDNGQGVSPWGPFFAARRTLNCSLPERGEKWPPRRRKKLHRAEVSGWRVVDMTSFLDGQAAASKSLGET